MAVYLVYKYLGLGSLRTDHVFTLVVSMFVLRMFVFHYLSDVLRSCSLSALARDDDESMANQVEIRATRCSIERSTARLDRYCTQFDKKSCHRNNN